MVGGAGETVMGDAPPAHRVRLLFRAGATTHVGRDRARHRCHAVLLRESDAAGVTAPTLSRAGNSQTATLRAAHRALAPLLSFERDGCRCAPRCASVVFGGWLTVEAGHHVRGPVSPHHA